MNQNILEQSILERHKNFQEKGCLLRDLQFLNHPGILRVPELGTPGRKHELFTYVETNSVLTSAYKEPPSGLNIDRSVIEGHIYPGCEKSCLVFLNGVFNSELSNLTAISDTVEVVNLSEQELDADIKQELINSIQQEKDLFAVLNAAFCPSGIFIRTFPDKPVESTLQMLFITQGEGAHIHSISPRVVAQVAQNSFLKIAAKHVGLGSGYFSNPTQDFFVKERGEIQYIQTHSEPADCWNFSKTRIQLEKESKGVVTVATSGSRTTRSNIETRLKGEGADFKMGYLSIVGGKDQAHNYSRVYHEAPGCTSDQHFNNIIMDEARSSVDTTVVVEKGADETLSDQLIKNLLLSDQGLVATKPNLMIFADDVKCTHGATTGQIDQDQLFYLLARGIPMNQAKHMLITGFVQHILNQVGNKAILLDINTNLLNKIEEAYATL